MSFFKALPILILCYFIAVEKGRTKLVKHLCNAGVRFYAKDESGKSAFYYGKRLHIKKFFYFLNYSNVLALNKYYKFKIIHEILQKSFIHDANHNCYLPYHISQGEENRYDAASCKMLSFTVFIYF